MSAAEDAAPVSAAEARELFQPLARASALVLAISGGPDSTALLVLAARWRRARKRGPKLVAVTVDHGLRRESAREARLVAQLARRLGISHRILRWEGEKPVAGLQEAAREARYLLLTAAARRARAGYILTAHTLDDQAETVLLRMARGSGPSGLGAMAPMTTLATADDIALVRPLLGVPKTRLIATLERAKIGFVQDPSNADPRFARTRLREVMLTLAGEGLDARRLAVLARRMRRAEAAIEVAVGAAAAALTRAPSSIAGPIRFDAAGFAILPAEVALRLLGRAIDWTGNEGAARLGKLEALLAAIRRANAPAGREGHRLRRTLAGALVTLTDNELAVERAPPRRRAGGKEQG